MGSDPGPIRPMSWNAPPAATVEETGGPITLEYQRLEFYGADPLYSPAIFPDIGWDLGALFNGGNGWVKPLFLSGTWGLTLGPINEQGHCFPGRKGFFLAGEKIPGGALPGDGVRKKAPGSSGPGVNNRKGIPLLTRTGVGGGKKNRAGDPRAPRGGTPGKPRGVGPLLGGGKAAPGGRDTQLRENTPCKKNAGLKK